MASSQSSGNNIRGSRYLGLVRHMLVENKILMVFWVEGLSVDELSRRMVDPLLYKRNCALKNSRVSLYVASEYHIKRLCLPQLFFACRSPGILYPEFPFSTSQI